MKVKKRIFVNVVLVFLFLFCVSSSLIARDFDPTKDATFSMSGGRLITEFVASGNKLDVGDFGKEGINFTSGMMLFLDFQFKPIKNFYGKFSINILGSTAEKTMQSYYGMRGSSYNALITKKTNGLTPLKATDYKTIKGNERVELYNFDVTFNHEYFNVHAFHHVPKFHLGYEGDMFGLYWEATDMDNMDRYNAKAPSGIEFNVKKGLLRGLKIIAGPEIYWHANPKVIAKYSRDLKFMDFTLMHSEDIARSRDTTALKAIPKATRKTTLHLRTKVIPKTTIELGFIMAGTEKVGENFVRVVQNGTTGGAWNNGYVALDDYVRFKDTLGLRAKAELNLNNKFVADLGFTYAGLVADGGAPVFNNGTLMPYSGLGNKMVIEGGLGFHLGAIHITPRAMYRKNVVKANPVLNPIYAAGSFTAGVTPRNEEDDPFAVTSNREVFSAEIVFTFDPTGATWFYNWDNSKKEDAKLAFNLALNYSRFLGYTDAYTFWHLETATTKGFTTGFPSADVWTGKARVVINPTSRIRMIATAEAGIGQQANGFSYDENRAGRTVDFYGLGFDLYTRRFAIKSWIKKDAWGPEDYYREFNYTYPWQWEIDFSVRFDKMLGFVNNSRIGIKYTHRTMDANSLPAEYQNGKNTYMYEFNMYYEVAF